jgi:hypothetical protein
MLDRRCFCFSSDWLQASILDLTESPEKIYDLAISSFERWSIAISFTIFLTFTDYF